MIEHLIPFYKPRDIIIEKSEDCYQYDINNQRYIDFEPGVWCANAGHNNKRINKVIEDQIKVNIHHGYIFRNRFSEELARTLHQMFGFMHYDVSPDIVVTAIGLGNGYPVFEF